VTAQFKSKPAAVQTNMAAVRLGVEYAREHFKKSDAFRLEPMSGVTDGLMFMDGNRAAALAASWRMHVCRVVSDHAFVVAVRVVHPALRPLSHRCEDRRAQGGDRSGRGRAGGRRHGVRCGLGGRPCDDVDVRPAFR